MKVIKVENLSKIYRLGEIGTGTISRDVERWFKTKVLRQDDPYLKIGETNDRANKGASDIVYSLKDINFEIEQGDAVGIIGRNGAGKSTLLKILSRVTTPTTGRININGRVASLLEVGTGFHPELTGRENIYLNGVILGMRKREIDRKLDEIIDFSGVERYIDTPVKRYSSGMYVRLAFAVAAHLESEILIVDEVLAVGDAEFQNKCLGKMGEVSKGEGRTVLFVSHNMAAMRNLCKNGILLDKGLSFIGAQNIEKVILQYQNNSTNSFSKIWQGEKFTSNGLIRLYEVSIVNTSVNSLFTNESNLKLNFCYQVLKKENRKLRIVFNIETQDNLVCFSSGLFIECNVEGFYIAEVDLPKCIFNKKYYKISARVDYPYESVYLEQQEYINFEIQLLSTHSYGVIDENEPVGLLHFPLSYVIRSIDE